MPREYFATDKNGTQEKKPITVRHGTNEMNKEDYFALVLNTRSLFFATQFHFAGAMDTEKLAQALKLTKATVFAKNTMPSEQELVAAAAADTANAALAKEILEAEKIAQNKLIADVIEPAHGWLSQNTTGPWFWDELWMYHQLAGAQMLSAVSLYVERLPDQEGFKAAFGHAFSFTANNQNQLYRHAILLGVLPLPKPGEGMSPQTPIPEDFMAYLRGERENYEAPFIEMRRPRPPSPSGTPAPGAGGGKA